MSLKFKSKAEREADKREEAEREAVRLKEEQR
jgi:hypothetical protein